jgi:alkylhydroperoxidase family enzyme
MSNNLSPVTEPFHDDVAKILETYPKRDGYVLQLFRVFANSVRFLRKGTVNLLDRDSPLPMKQREIVILRVCANNDCEYEWGVHVTAFADHVGLTEAQVRATRLEPADSDLWGEEECVLLRVVDQLCANGRVDADTKQPFQDSWSVEQQLEVLALCGNYHTVSFVANTAGLAPEPFGARFPSS